MRLISLKMAMRSLGRNPRRTALSLIGIALGCTLATLMVGIQYGAKGAYLEGVALAGSGHLRVVPGAWPSRRDAGLRLAAPDAALRSLRNLCEVKAAAPRVRVQALLAMGTRVEGVELVGVAPEAEPVANRLVRTVARGRYLAPSERGAVVLGEQLARRLRVDLDDDLVATAVSSGGQMESIMLRLVGLVSTGSSEVDAGIAQTSIADAAALSGTPGLGEISVVLSEPERAESVRAKVASALDGTDVVIGMAEIEPTLYGHIQQDRATSNIFIALAVFLVFLGLAGAQLTAALERRKEFAVLSAIGMKPRQIALQTLLEALVLGFAGSVAALIASLPLMYWFHKTGIDLRSLMGSDVTINGLYVEPRLVGGFGLWIVYLTVTLAVTSTVLASIYPARFAARTDPSQALRVAQ